MESTNFIKKLNLNPSCTLTNTNLKNMNFELKDCFKYRNSYFTPYKKNRLQQFFSSTASLVNQPSQSKLSRIRKNNLAFQGKFLDKNINKNKTKEKKKDQKLGLGLDLDLDLVLDKDKGKDKDKDKDKKTAFRNYISKLPMNFTSKPQVFNTLSKYITKLTIDTNKERKKLGHMINLINTLESTKTNEKRQKTEKEKALRSQLNINNYENKLAEFELTYKPSTQVNKKYSPKNLNLKNNNKPYYTLVSHATDKLIDPDLMSGYAKTIEWQKEKLAQHKITEIFSSTNKITKHKKFEKMKNKIIDCCGLIRNLHLDLNLLKECSIFPAKPFERPFSKDFIFSIKGNDLYSSTYYLSKNKLLVYDFDQMHRTALHWATRNNNCQLMKILLDLNADPNSFDQASRRPIHFAAKNNSLNAIKMLLYYGANPLYLTQSKKSCIDFATNPAIKGVLRRAKYVYILMKWANPKSKLTFLETYGKNYWSTFKVNEFEKFEKFEDGEKEENEENDKKYWED